VKEGRDVAGIYSNLSVAEQNSVDLAWGLLMERGYEDLRRYIYVTRAEQGRFRQLSLDEGVMKSAHRRTHKITFWGMSTLGMQQLIVIRGKGASNSLVQEKLLKETSRIW
jgi:hypothetical protein